MIKPPITPPPSAAEQRAALAKLRADTLRYKARNDKTVIVMPDGTAYKAPSTAAVLKEHAEGRCVSCGGKALPHARDICPHCRRWSCSAICYERHAEIHRDV